MSQGDAPKRKTHIFIKLAIVIICVAVPAFVVLSLSVGGFDFLRVLSFLPQRVPEITVSEFSFDVGKDRDFAFMEGHVAAVGSLGLQVFDSAGRETLRSQFRMNSPAILNNGTRSIAFDIGGTSVRVFDYAQILASIETDDLIVSASINPNGWFCVVTQERISGRSMITVYNSSGLDVYVVGMATGFALLAELSHDNSDLAILNLTSAGSRITLYQKIFDDEFKDEPDIVFDIKSGLIIYISYLPSGDILAISTNLLFLVDASGTGTVLYHFEGRQFGDFTYSDDFISLHLYDFALGHQGILVTLLLDGTVVKEKFVDRDIISMSSADETLMILKSDGVMFYNKELHEFPASIENPFASAAGQVIAVSEDAVLAASDNLAVVIRREHVR